MEPKLPASPAQRAVPDSKALEGLAPTTQTPSAILGFRVAHLPLHPDRAFPEDFILDPDVCGYLPTVTRRVRLSWDICSQGIPRGIPIPSKEVLLLSPVNNITRVPKWLPYNVQWVFDACGQPVNNLWFTHKSKRVLYVCTGNPEQIHTLWARLFISSTEVRTLRPQP